ncbi:hypothetical protein ISN44_Un159g000330 (mitochondrion) [Arabidopsis suecica]|uniref:Uncharacterized protein n=1 Tax=Arabidopsis suecica TaxID=45249 RepID=A0A8T1XA15_ARASU|nr:hypothetical protein ISN44_Un159g000330 [Arabidopsis suecica]
MPAPKAMITCPLVHRDLGHTPKRLPLDSRPYLSFTASVDGRKEGKLQKCSEGSRRSYESKDLQIEERTLLLAPEPFPRVRRVGFPVYPQRRSRPPPGRRPRVITHSSHNKSTLKLTYSLGQSSECGSRRSRAPAAYSSAPRNRAKWSPITRLTNSAWGGAHRAKDFSVRKLGSMDSLYSSRRYCRIME